MNRSQLGHRLLRQLVKPGEQAFQKHSRNLEDSQKKRLAGILRQVAAVSGERASWHGRWDWKTFTSTQPVTVYADWKQGIEQQMSRESPVLSSSPVSRYQPTSGSSSTIKWIPYTRQFLTELDGAIAPWMSDLYRQYPRIGHGRHYWSLSWLPTNMRRDSSAHLNDDMKLLSFGKRALMTHTQAVPEGVALAPSSDDAMFATLAHLAAAPDLAMLSVWSPTFALGLLENLARWREPLVEVLATGHWGHREDALAPLQAPFSRLAARKLAAWDGKLCSDFFRVLWPDLALVSAWGTAAAAPWANELRKWLPHADFQGKGLWATEGVITIPRGEHHVLAANSHVYEFEVPATGRIIAPWEAEPGQEVSPLITTGSGLLRYRLGDQLRVTGHIDGVPCLQFLGRGNTVDLVGEKTDAVAVQRWLDGIEWPANVRPVTILGTNNGGAAGRLGWCSRPPAA